MAIIGRFAGAILLQTKDRHFLIGDLKEPCKFQERGFLAPAERDVIKQPSIPLERCGELVLDDDYILSVKDIDEEDLAEKIVNCFMIFRNGSISERLWGLVTETSEKEGKTVDAQWLVDTPEDVWEVVRDSILRC